MATSEDLLTARIVLRAVLPLIKVMVEDAPKKRAQFEGVTGTIQFSAKDESGPIGAHIHFDNGAFSLVQELIDNPDIHFVFPSVAKMNAMFRGKPVLPSLGPLARSAFRNFGLLVKTFGLLLGLKLLMPDAKPKNAEQARLKVKMTLYMVSTALSQLNKFGDPEMIKWTAKQPERIYQMLVEPDGIAAYLRVSAGKSKAGRGVYERRRPFVLMRFKSVDGALAVMNKEVGFIEGVAKGFVSVEGSPEYAANFSDFMMRVQGLLTG